MQMPDRHDDIVQEMKKLIPAEYRKPSVYGDWGWYYDLLAWRLPIDYLLPMIEVCDKLAPKWAIEMVEAINKPERQWENAQSDS